MHVVTDDFNGHRGGVKVLKLQLAHAPAVHGIGPLCAKRRDVEVLRPFSYLFIRGKGHADLAVGHVLLNQYRERGHDLRHASLIVRAKQGFAIGGDQRLPQQLMQHREHHRREDLIPYAKGNIAAAVVLDNLRIDVLAGEVRGGIDVGDEPNSGDIALHVSRQRCHHRAFITQRHVGEAHLIKLIAKQL